MSIEVPFQPRLRRRKKRRKKPGYVRPSRAKPKTGWSLRELARCSGVAARTVHFYLQSGVLPRPPYKGKATRYERQHLLSLLAIRRLRTSERLALVRVKARIAAMSPLELHAFATEHLPPGPAADALGIRSALPTAVVGAPATSMGSTVVNGLPLAPSTPRWSRVELALGLELHLREDAGAQAAELAKRVLELCGVGALKAR
jgi:DNA-binding transcriptional MerR regulator